MWCCRFFEGVVPAASTKGMERVAELNAEVGDLCDQYLDCLEKIKIRDAIVKVLMVSAAGNKFFQVCAFRLHYRSAAIIVQPLFPKVVGWLPLVSHTYIGHEDHLQIVIASVLGSKPKYRLDNPGNYFILLSIYIFLGSKYPRIFYFSYGKSFTATLSFTHTGQRVCSGQNFGYVTLSIIYVKYARHRLLDQSIP